MFFKKHFSVSKLVKGLGGIKNPSSALITPRPGIIALPIIFSNILEPNIAAYTYRNPPFCSFTSFSNFW